MWVYIYNIVYIYIYMYIYFFFYIFFIHLSVDGHLVCFPILTTINSSAMYIGVHVSF